MRYVLSQRVPELSALELLLSVAREGSVGRAAALHGISQPAASSRVHNMERLLGFPLLERGPRGSSLTTRGALVADWAQAVVDAAEALDAGIAALRTDTHARLSLVASLTVAEHLLPGWLAQWRAQQPDIQVSVVGTNSAAAAEQVLDGTADLGFIEGPSVPSGLTSRVVATDRLVLVVAPQHPWTRRRRPVTAGELAATALVQREPHSGTRVAFERALRRATAEPARDEAELRFATPALELSTASAVRGAAAAGVAPTVLSNLAVRDDLAAGRLIELPVSGVDFSRRLRAIWPRGHQPSGPARDLLALIGRTQTARSA